MCLLKKQKSSSLKEMLTWLCTHLKMFAQKLTQGSFWLDLSSSILLQNIFLFHKFISKRRADYRDCVIWSDNMKLKLEKELLYDNIEKENFGWSLKMMPEGW